MATAGLSPPSRGDYSAVIETPRYAWLLRVRVGRVGRTPLRSRADHALDQVVHALELGLGDGVGRAGRDDRIALVVLERAFVDHQAAVQDRGLRRIGLLLGRGRHRRPIGRGPDEAFL